MHPPTHILRFKTNKTNWGKPPARAAPGLSGLRPDIPGNPRRAGWPRDLAGKGAPCSSRDR